MTHTEQEELQRRIEHVKRKLSGSDRKVKESEEGKDSLVRGICWLVLSFFVITWLFPLFKVIGLEILSALLGGILLCVLFCFLIMGAAMGAVMANPIAKIALIGSIGVAWGVSHVKRKQRDALFGEQVMDYLDWVYPSLYEPFPDSYIPDTLAIRTRMFGGGLYGTTSINGQGWNLVQAENEQGEMCSSLNMKVGHAYRKDIQYFQGTLFNKPLSSDFAGSLIIQPRALSWMNQFDTSYQRFREPFKAGMQEFDAAFRMEGSPNVDWHKVLTPSICAYLLELQEAFPAQVGASLADGQLYIAIYRETKVLYFGQVIYSTLGSLPTDDDFEAYLNLHKFREQLLLG